jgi:hypothetical protein
MNFTDKDYEDALRLRVVTELAGFKMHTPYPLKPAGGYRMSGPYGITFNLNKKPLWIHRMGVRLVLGWKWVDA